MEQVIALLRDYGLQILATVVIGYLVGSVSFSIIFTRPVSYTHLTLPTN